MLKWQTLDEKNRKDFESETLLEEVLDTISGQEDLRDIDGTAERFWDMFVVDAFVGNNDRNNGNWGLLHDLSSDSMALAPVYDNGAADPLALFIKGYIDSAIFNR